MPFSINCPNKGCGKYTEPLLNTETNEAECSDCGGIINITIFAKSQMKSLGQIKRDGKKQQAFSVQCKNCKKSSVPIVNSESVVLCSLCKTKLDISEPYANLIREKFKKNGA